MMNLRSVRCIASGLALCAAASGCNRESPYRIGVVLDKPGREGASIAVARVNDQGGINGHPLELRMVRGAPATSARSALETAEKLCADPTVLAVIGHTNSSWSLAAAQVYNARHVVQIAPTVTAPLYGQAGAYSFRLVASDVHQGVYLAEQALAHRPHPRVAVVFVNNDYGRPLHGILIKRLGALGVSAVYDAPFSEVDSVRGLEVVESLARAKPDVMIWIGRSGPFARIARSLRTVMPGLVVLASDAFSRGPAPTDTLRLFDGVRYVRHVDIERPDSALQHLRERYRRTGRGELTDQTVLAYDAVILLAEGLRSAGPSRELLRDWLARVGHDVPPVAGLSGPIAFDDGRDRKPRYFLQEIMTSKGGAP